MAIVTIKASKATPGKALNYITDKGKAAFVSCLHLDPSQDLARQMMATAKLWGKAQNESDRKYYHLKIAFAPEDWVENGGTLTEREALQIGMVIMREFCPTSEGVGSVHIDKKHLHFHGIINAVDLESGKLLDMRRADYRRLKDRAQELCAERGLNAMDWRKATKEKRDQEIETQPRQAETLTQAEMGIRAREGIPDAEKLQAGKKSKYSWKDEIRAVVGFAKENSRTLKEFNEILQDYGIETPRNTAKNISYLHPDQKKAVRGDTLGGDYTKAAILAAIERNRDRAMQPQRRPTIQELIDKAAAEAKAQRGQEQEHTMSSLGQVRRRSR